MPEGKHGRLAPGVLSSCGIGLVVMASVVDAACACGQTVFVPVALASTQTPSDPSLPDFHTSTPDIGLVIGGSGVPIPGIDYVDAAHNLYIDRLVPHVTEPGVLANGVFTPEGLYPLDGIRVLQLDKSVAEGVTILNDHIQANLKDGDTTTVFGYSQSAEIASQEMEKLDPTNTPSDLPINFVPVGNVDNPNGGLLERFNGFENSSGTHDTPQLSLPSLGITFNGATPDDSFPTAIYTLEYDGFADFPRYPLNFLSDLNAFLGIRTLHGTYLNGGVDGSGPTPEQITDAIQLNTSGPTETSYFMIPETAPLVARLPDPLQELLGPDLTYLINLGYGDGSQGWSDGPANVPTPFGLFPDVSPQDVFSHLVSGFEQGLKDFEADTFDSGSSAGNVATITSADMSSDTTTTATIPGTTGTGDVTVSVGDVGHGISGAISELTGAQSGLTDVINALFTVMPTYGWTLFSDNLSDGNLLDAIGLPLAADTALITLAGGFTVQILDNAFRAVSGDLSDLGG